MRTRSLLPLMLLSAATAACTNPATTHETAKSGNNAPAAASARVGLTEWSIITSTRRLSPGPVVITVTNTGSTAHDLLVRGGKVRAHTRELRPGKRQTLRLDAPPGQALHLSCTLPGHHQAGMHATVTVAGKSTANG